MDKKIKANTSLKVLYIEDTPRDAEIISELILDSGYNLEMDIAEAKEGYETFLRTRNYDIILSDFKLPGFDAFGALQLRNEICPSIPFICVSGSIGEETAIELLKLGADDYILKDKPERLPFAIKRAIDDAKERDEHLKAEELLHESEEKYRLLFDCNPHPMWVYDLDNLNFLLVNDAAIIKYGYSREEFLKMNLKDIRPVEDVNKLLDDVKMSSGEISFSGEWQHKNKKGDIFLVEIISHSIFLNQKNARLVLANDITERKKAEAALSDTEERYREVVEEAVENIFTTDGNGYFTYANPSALKFSGYSLEELKKFKFSDIVIPAYKKRVAITYFRQFLKRESVSYTEYPFLTKSGEVKWFGQNARLINDNGVIKGFYVIARDITERREIEEKLKKKTDELDRFFTNNLDLLCIADTNGYFRRLNPEWEQTLGYSVAELEGKRFLDFVHQEDIVATLESLSTLAMQSEVTSFVNRYRHKDGLYRWIEWRSYPDGKTIYASARDITSRILAEAELKKLNRAVEQSSVCVVITDTDGNIEYVNPFFTELTGYEFEEIKGKKTSILKSGYHTNEHHEHLWETILTGKVWRGEMQNKKKDGEIVWLNATISPIINNNGDITNFVAIEEDITEKKKLIEDLTISKEKAELANKLKDAFINNMSHEIRTPLNGILGLTSIIKENYAGYIEKEDESLFTGIDNSAQRIIRTVDMILIYSSLQSGAFTVIPKQINLFEICEHIINRNREAAEGKKLELLVDNRCEDAKITGDEYTVTQIVSNLVENAIKYTIKGGIIITLFPQPDGKITFEIKDTGIGIAKEYLEHLFEPYRQEEMGYGRSYEGIGLGLALTKKFVELNNALLSVESMKGEGTTFTIKFNSAGELKIDKFALKEQIKTVNPSIVKSEGKAVILIVEDDTFNKEILVRVLDKKYKTYTANSAEEVYNVLKKNEIDLILMDISIYGEKDGLELTRELKGTNEYAHIPIIAVTAHAGNNDQGNALAAGCDEYLAKPYSMDQLMKKIGKFVKI